MFLNRISFRNRISLGKQRHKINYYSVRTEYAIYPTLLLKQWSVRGISVLNVFTENGYD